VNTVVCIAGVVLVLLVFHDVFHGILVPGRTKRRLRFIPYYFQGSWAVWSFFIRRIHTEDLRERLLTVYGPLAMIGLLLLWAVGLMVGFGLLQAGLTPGPWPTVFVEGMLAAGSRMFTVGVGDWARYAMASKILAVVVSGTGLGFFTMVITYMPVLYQLFSRRETHVILLDERAGSPVTAASLIQNHARRNAIGKLDDLIEDWEKWSAELLESHVSYPMLSYYRSQHSNQCWLTAMAVVMDVCALRLAGAGATDEFQAEATFSMCLSALRSIAEILRIEPLDRYDDRLPGDRLHGLRDKLREWRQPDGGRDLEARLGRIRETYDPLIAAMADYLLVRLPDWIPAEMIQAPLEAARR